MLTSSGWPQQLQLISHSECINIFKHHSLWNTKGKLFNCRYNNHSMHGTKLQGWFYPLFKHPHLFTWPFKQRTLEKKMKMLRWATGMGRRENGESHPSLLKQSCHMTTDSEYWRTYSGVFNRAIFIKDLLYQLNKSSIYYEFQNLQGNIKTGISPWWY